MKKVTISSDAYKFAHGKAPSGYGSWAFDIVDASSRSVVKTVFAPSSTLTDAKKWVTNWVKTNMAAELETGCLEVNVAS